MLKEFSCLQCSAIQTRSSNSRFCFECIKQRQSEYKKKYKKKERLIQHIAKLAPNLETKLELIDKRKNELRQEYFSKFIGRKMSFERYLTEDFYLHEIYKQADNMCVVKNV